MSKVIWEARHDLRGNVRYLKELKDLADRNRNNPTPAEKLIWDKLLLNDIEKVKTKLLESLPC